MSLYYLDYAVAICIITSIPIFLCWVIIRETAKDNGGIWNWFQNLRCKLRWKTDLLRR